jgi:hypothetical protein
VFWENGPSNYWGKLVAGIIDIKVIRNVLKMLVLDLVCANKFALIKKFATPSTHA